MSAESFHAHEMTQLKATHNRFKADLRDILRDAKDSIEIGKPDFAIRFIQQALEKIS